MEKDVCPLCERRISNWEIASGKVMHIDGKLIHKACAMDKDESIAQLKARIHES